jgi:hypothetical protein
MIWSFIKTIAATSSMMGINQLFTVDALEEEPKDIDLGR